MLCTQQKQVNLSSYIKVRIFKGKKKEKDHIDDENPKDFESRKFEQSSLGDNFEVLLVLQV